MKNLYKETATAKPAKAIILPSIKEDNSMKALVLAAGKGNRLEGFTTQKPKGLLPVAGMPLLGRVLHNLKEAGVQDVWVVVGYKGDMIRKEIGEKYAGLKIHYITASNWKKGNLHSFLAAQEIFETNFILCMSDHIFDPSIAKTLLKCKLDNTLILAIDRKDYTSDDNKVLEQDGIIIKIGKSINPFNGVDTGLFLCSPKIFKYAKEAAQQEAVELVDAVRIAALNKDAKVIDISGHYWADIDTKQDLERGKRILVKATQKKRGASDFIAHYIHRPIENTIIYHLSDLKVTPNQLTIMTNVLAWSITYLFFSGQLLIGSILTFVVGVMDGLDGKLARIKRRETRLGRMEHAFDLLFEFSWLIALALFLSRNEGLLPLELCMFALMFIAFYRLCYDQFSRTMKVSLDIYGRFERVFRRIAGRRNIYNIYIFIGVIFSIPLYSLFGILIHSALTAVVYAYRAAVHMHTADKKSV
ncbi:MAG: NTP transferase domain-containing protein [Candidatus Bathyarchaeia archaeon]